MQQSPFIWLGSGRSRKRGVSQKGKMLDLAARGGLPVPQGGILQDEFYRICLAEGLVELVEQRVIIPDPKWFFEVLYRDIRFPKLKGLAAVRSATAEPKRDKERTFAQLNVDGNEPQQLANAFKAIWSELLAENQNLQMDVLVMSMVDTRRQGVATSFQNREEDEMHLSGDTEHSPGAIIYLPRVRAFWRPTVKLSPYARRLQRLLAGVRRTFGQGDYEINWVDDGQICWLIQVL